MPKVVGIPGPTGAGMTQPVRLLRVSLLALMGAVTVLGAVVALTAPDVAWHSLRLVVLMDLAGVLLLALDRVGRTLLASSFLLVLLAAVATLYAALGGGLYAPVPSAYLVITLLAGLLFPRWAGSATAALLSFAVLALGFLELSRVLLPPTARHSPLVVWLTMAISISGICAIQFIAVRSVHVAQQRSGEREDALNRALEAFEEETRKLHSILDSMAEAVVVADASGDIIEFNEAARRLHGMGPEDDEPTGWAERCGLFLADGETLCPPDDLPLQRAIRGEATDEVELVVKRRDGSSRLVEVTGRPIVGDDGRTAGGVVVFTDVTERKCDREALAISEEKARGILESVSDGFFTLDRDWRYTYLNPAAARFVGRRAEDLVGKRIWDVFPEAANSPFHRVYHRAMETGEVTPFEEYFAPLQAWAGGTVYPYEHGITIIFQDVTERKRAEEKMRQQLASLTALHEGAGNLAGTLDSSKLAEDAARTCVELFGAGVAWVGVAEVNGLVRPLAQFPPHPVGLIPPVIRWDDSSDGLGPTGHAIRSGSPAVVCNVAEYSPAETWRDWALAKGFHCAAAFPLISRGNPFGSLTLYGRDQGYATPDRIEVFQTYAHEVAAALANARLFEETERRLKHVQALRRIDRAITSSLDPVMTFDILLDQVLAELKVDAADILLMTRETLTLRFAAGHGFRSPEVQKTALRLGEDDAGLAALERRTISGTLAGEGTHMRAVALTRAEGFGWRAAAPLTAKGEVKGVLEVFSRSPLDPDEDWFTFFETLAGQAAVAIDSASLFDDLQRSNVELKLAYDATIEGWSRALDLRDKETEGHTQRVTEMSVKLARAMRMREEELVHLRRGALLHDIGKMGVPDAVLHKAGPLTDEEWEVMRKHTTYALELLYPIRYLRPAIDIPYAHHERWDGTGYPRGRKGEQIPLTARIFSIVDVWDALRSDRPYRAGWDAAKVREHILSLSGKAFDPAVVEAFLALDPD
jgi:PAS domain S-box-containing protein/putative nucleotidyltransferase with HDIG domain